MAEPPDKTGRRPSEGFGKRKRPADLAGFTVPTPEELVEKKKARLASELPEETRPYLPRAIRAQLVGFIDNDGIYPVSAVSFLQQRADFLERSEIPQQVFQIDRQDLPSQTAPEDQDYPVIDYLTAVYSGASLFPLRSMAAMSVLESKRSVDAMDPIVRRELSRKGLLGYELTSKSGLDPKAPDVKKLKAANYGSDVLSIVRAAVNCYGDSWKQAMFQSVMETRLTARANTLDKSVHRATHGRVEKSSTANELRELSMPENIAYVMERLHTEAAPWVAEHFTPDAEVIALPNARVEDYINVFDNNPFWFQDRDKETAQRYLEGFASSVEAAIETALDALEETKSVSGYADLAVPAARGAQYVEMYLGTTLEQLVTDTIEERLHEYIESSLAVYRDTQAGGQLPFLLDDVMTGLKDKWIARLRDAKRPAMEKVAANDTADAQLSNNVIDLTAVRAERAHATAVEPTREGTLSQNLEIILREVGNEVKHVPTELRQRFSLLSFQIGTAFVRAVLHEERAKLRTTDLYVTYQSHSKLFQVNRLNRLIKGGDLAEGATQSIIDNELMKLSDQDFADVYDSLMNNYDTGPFGVQIFSERYEWLGEGTYSNQLSQSRNRLLDLLEKQPGLFHSAKFVEAYQRWKKNEAEREG